MRFDGLALTTLFGPKWRLLLVGAGQLSQAVAQMARMLDFEVLVCDPREEYSGTLGITGATHLPGMPDDVVRELRPDAHTAIVALTHDPKLDDMALLEALRSDAFYVGALGSSRNQAARKKRLAEHFDLTEAELARLHGPVGLRIGAKTPAEIAVSVVAQIVERKNRSDQAVRPAAGCAVRHEPARRARPGVRPGRALRRIGRHRLQTAGALGGKPVLERTLDAVRASGLPWHLERRRPRRHGRFDRSRRACHAGRAGLAGAAGRSAAGAARKPAGCRRGPGNAHRRGAVLPGPARPSRWVSPHRAAMRC